MKPKLRLTTMDFIQKSYNGGFPLDNEDAHMLQIGHGTPLILMPKRQFVALLKQCLSAIDLTANRDVAEELTNLLGEHDQFIKKVEIKELYEVNDAVPSD